MAKSSGLCLIFIHHTHVQIVAQMLDTYKFDRMKIHDVAVTPDSQRILAVGPLLSSPTGLQPSTSRVEKRLVGTWLRTSLRRIAQAGALQSTTWIRNWWKSQSSSSMIVGITLKYL
jgi:hypothetical protein